jgi:hypothetical protein
MGRVKTVLVCDILDNPLKVEAIGAGAALRYGAGSGATKMMRLLAAPCSSGSAALAGYFRGETFFYHKLIKVQQWKIN